jgi:SAM-dependent methyltransferase
VGGGQERYRDGTYARDNPGWHAEDALPKARAVLAAVEALDWRPRTVLDVGCGTGDVLRQLKRLLDDRGDRDVRFEGWDTSAPLGPDEPRLSLHAGNPLLTLPRADLVLCLDVLEHVVDEDGFLAGLPALGRRFVFRLPLDLSVLDLLRPHRLLETRRRYGHLRAWNRAMVIATLVEAGFVVRYEAFHRIDPPTYTLRRRLADGLRRALFTVAPRTTVLLLGGFSLVVGAERANGGGDGRGPAD